MRHAMTLLVVVLASMVGACVSDAPAPALAPPSVDVRGIWKGSWVFDNNNSRGDVTLELAQQGPDLSGNATVTDRTGTKNTYFTGTVTGNTIILKPPYASGTLTVNGDDMTGTVEGIMPANVVLHRQH